MIRHLTPANFDKELFLEFNLGPQVNVTKRTLHLSSNQIILHNHNGTTQHMLEGLVDEVYDAMGKEYLYKRDSRGRLASGSGRLADHLTAMAIKSFRAADAS